MVEASEEELFVLNVALKAIHQVMKEETVVQQLRPL